MLSPTIIIRNICTSALPVGCCPLLLWKVKGEWPDWYGRAYTVASESFYWSSTWRCYVSCTQRCQSGYLDYCSLEPVWPFISDEMIRLYVSMLKADKITFYLHSSIWGRHELELLTSRCRAAEERPADWIISWMSRRTGDPDKSVRI